MGARIASTRQIGSSQIRFFFAAGFQLFAAGFCLGNRVDFESESWPSWLPSTARRGVAVPDGARTSCVAVRPIRQRTTSSTPARPRGLLAPPVERRSFAAPGIHRRALLLRASLHADGKSPRYTGRVCGAPVPNGSLSFHWWYLDDKMASVPRNFCAMTARVTVLFSGCGGAMNLPPGHEGAVAVVSEACARDA